jgi:hypothetical protein
MMIASTGQTAGTPGSTLLEQRPWIPDVRQAIERMSARVDAVHADRNSLQRTARGLSAIHRQLSVVLDMSVRSHGWNPENRMADAALASMTQQIQAALTADSAASVENERECLRHAVFRAVDAATLLEQ